MSVSSKAKLRAFVVRCQILLAFFLFVAALTLSYQGKSSVREFLIAGLLASLSASVTATSLRVALPECLRGNNLLGEKPTDVK